MLDIQLLPGPDQMVLDVSHYIQSIAAPMAKLPIKLDNNVFFIELLEASSIRGYGECIIEALVEGHIQAFCEEHDLGDTVNFDEFKETAITLVNDLMMTFASIGIYSKDDEHFMMLEKWISPDVVILAKGHSDYELGIHADPRYERPNMFLLPLERVSTLERTVSAVMPTKQFKRGTRQPAFKKQHNDNGVIF